MRIRDGTCADTRVFRMQFILLLLLTAVFFSVPVQAKAAKGSIVSFEVQKAAVTVEDTGGEGGVRVASGYAISWDTEGFDETRDAVIRIYADVDGENFDGTLVTSFAGGVRGTWRYTEEPAQPGYYRYYITVTQGKKVRRRYFDEVFHVVRSEAAPEVEDLKIWVEDDVPKLTFLGTEGQIYRVMIYDKETVRPLAADLAESSSEGTVNLDFPDMADAGCKMIGVAEYTVTDAGESWGNFTLYEIPDPSEPAVNVSFPEGDVTNKADMDVLVDYTGRYSVTMTVNGRSVGTAPAASGVRSVRLGEGISDISVTVTAENGNIRHYEKQVVVDTVPPFIDLGETIDQAVTLEERVRVHGTTEAGSTMVINDRNVSVSKGSFSSTVALSYGRNVIVLTATDEAGNVNRMSVTVTRQDMAEQTRSTRVAVIIGTFFGLIFVAYIISFIIDYRRWKEKKRRLAQKQAEKKEEAPPEESAEKTPEEPEENEDLKS